MKKVVALASFSVLAACGSKSNDDQATAVSRTVVVEVGASVASLLGDETNEGEGEDNEIKNQCRDAFAGTAKKWKVAASENTVNITATEAFAIKITGNQNVLNLVIKAKEGETAPVSFPGVCLVLGGNQASVQATLTDVSLEHIKIIGEGHDGRIDVKLQGAAKLPEGAAEDLGEHVTVTVTEATAVR